MVFMFSKQLESITDRPHMHLINDPITDKIALVWRSSRGFVVDQQHQKYPTRTAMIGPRSKARNQ